MKAASVLLFWLLSVSVSYAAHAPRHPAPTRRVCDPQTTTIKKFPRKPRSFGGPLLKPSERVLAGLSDPLTRLNRAGHGSVDDDDDEAIQNDAPATHIDVDHVPELRPLGVYIDPLELHPRTRAFSPRSPRGPPFAV